MSSDWTDTEMAVLRKMMKKAEEDPDFSAEDKEVIRQFLDAFKSLMFLGRFTKWVIFLLASIAGAIAVWDQLAAKVRTWLGG